MPDQSEHQTALPGLTIVLPAHDEAGLIGACLASVLRSDHAGQVECLVVANGCSDDTAQRARDFAPRFTERGWVLSVIELEQGGKLGALNAGDAAAAYDLRMYLDADVEISPALAGGLVTALDRPDPAYASGIVQIPPAKSWITRAYCAFYVQVPFMTHGVPGCGLFAMNGAGRARWGEWPDIISDDTFARLSFAPNERHLVDAPYAWPLVEGFGALVRVRRRQNAGVDEIAAKHPDLLANDDKPAFSRAGLLRAIARAPLGFVVYAAVALTVRLTKSRASGWSRGR